MGTQKKERVAVVGAGISGLGTAYLLRNDFDVTLFESDERLGGHAHTHEIQFGDDTVTVDSGFMVFNPERYPNLVGLFAELDVATTETTMSFSVNITDQVVFRGNFPFGIFAQPKNLFRPRFLRFIRGIVAFRKAGKDYLEKDLSHQQTLQEFFDEYGIGADVAEWFVYPMLAAVWSLKDTQTAAQFPALSTLRFLDNHKLLDQFRPRWRTVVDGSARYVEKVAAELEDAGVDIRLGESIESVSRSKRGIDVKIDGEKEQFEHVVFATHADVAKKLLADASKDEAKALGMFTYSANEAVLHSDTSLLPNQKNAIAAWNYQSNDIPSAKNVGAAFTYNMNILQHIPKQFPVFVTLNATDKIHPDAIHATIHYTHPEYTAGSIKGQAAIEKLQGSQNTYFAGAHLGYGFHEDGITSAVNVAEKLGVTPSWRV